MNSRYDEVFERIVAKFRRSLPMAAEMGIIPYKSENGRWIGSPYEGNSWWMGCSPTAATGRRSGAGC